MLTLVLETVEQYAQAHTTKESKILEELTKETFEKTKNPNMSVGHLQGSFLKLLVRITKAKRILEIGTFTGYSALSMAEVLPNDGELITLDIDPINTEIAKKYWANSSHGKKIKLIIGPAIQTINSLKDEFDFVFIDADKINYSHYWEAIVPKVKSGGLIVADNVLWSGRVLNPKDEESKALDAFNKLALSDKRVETVMLTVRDGIMLAHKQ